MESLMIISLFIIKMNLSSGLSSSKVKEENWMRKWDGEKRVEGRDNTRGIGEEGVQRRQVKNAEL